MAAVLSLVSCNKDSVNGNINAGTAGEGQLIVSISDGMMTKVAGDQSTNDKTIKNAQVFIFNKRTNQIDNAAYKTFASTSGSCTMDALTCTYGEKEIWAIVNAPKNYVAEGTIKTVDDLKKTTVVLSDNKTDALVMAGSKSVSFTAPTLAETIDVRRLVAAVVLKSVRNDMSVPAYREKLAITGAYLMNVPSIQSFEEVLGSGNGILASSTESPTSNWSAFYAKATAENVKDLLTDGFTKTNIEYGSGKEYTAPHTFYTYSNDFNKVEGKDNKTDKSSVYLVVECEVDGVACVYPVLLPALLNNNKYEVALTIQHVGGDPAKPWEKIHFTTFTPTINVVGWNEGGNPVSVPETI